MPEDFTPKSTARLPPHLLSREAHQEYESHVSCPPGEFLHQAQNFIKIIGELPEAKTRLGLEVEVENVAGWWSGMITRSKTWSWTSDGSLRNDGVEFISYPLNPVDVPVALGFLWACFKVFNERKVDFGWRSSFHVHMDMSHRTMEHVVKLLLVYLIFERSLFDYVNPKRQQSIFCIPLTKTPLGLEIGDFIHGKSSPADFLNHWDKYAALNLSPLRTLGTIEFRHLGGTASLRKITGWISLLLKLDSYVEATPLDGIVKHIADLNSSSYYYAFKEQVFGMDIGDLLQDVDQSRHMSDGVKFAKECLAYCPGAKIKNPSALLTIVEKGEKLRASSSPNPRSIFGLSPMDLSITSEADTSFIINNITYDEETE